MEINRNRMDEDWDERHECEAAVQEITLRDFTRKLESGGLTHTSYYHYTNWDAFAKMMTVVKSGPARGLRMLLLTPANKTNDGIERRWGRNVYLACFSYSLYEDVAMWMNYGKGNPDAVRIRFKGSKVCAWMERHCHGRGFFRATKANDGFCYESLDCRVIESVKLVDVAYVIPSKMIHGRLRGNVEYSRDFYRVLENGNMDWSDSVYGGCCREDLSPYFKKRGWCYERETRLVVILKERAMLPERLAVSFCGPFDELERQMRCGGDCVSRNLLSGPWYGEQNSSRRKICGVGIDEIGRSDYSREIKIITKCNECSILKKAKAGIHDNVARRDMVKVLAFCDVHESGYNGIDPTGHDIVLIAGDLQGFCCCSGPKPSARRIASQINWVNERFIPWCRKYPGTQFVVVAGNNDEFALDPANPLLNQPEGSNIHYLQDSGIEIKGLKIWGTPWVKPKLHRIGALKPFERKDEDFRKALAKMPAGVDILVSHATPAVEDSSIADLPEKHYGSEVLTEAIKEKKPKVCVCGHIHASHHYPVMLGETVIMNVSLIHNDRFHAEYRPRTFSMVKDEAGAFHLAQSYEEMHDNLKI